MCRMELNAPLAKEGIVLFHSGLKAVIVLDSERQFFLSYHFFSEQCFVSTQ